MRIQPVTYKLNTDIKPASKKEFAPKINDYKNLSLNNFYYTDNISFKGEWFDNNYVRKVKDKKYQGENLMNPNKTEKENGTILAKSAGDFYRPNLWIGKAPMKPIFTFLFTLFLWPKQKIQAGQEDLTRPTLKNRLQPCIQSRQET